MKKVAVTGATGFVGGQLVSSLLDSGEFQVIGLSRSKRKDEHLPNGQTVLWRSCDLYSLLDIENALEGVDTAFYLIHSMSPSAGLVQGSFDELDLLLADNFAKAARKCGVKHIIYLGGLIPEGASKHWSLHLRSRYEVEEILINSGVATTILRAGLIIGKGGSSIEILKRLVLRLPVMLCPAWTLSQSSAVSLEGVCRALLWSAENPPENTARIFDLGETPPMSYREMMREMARALGKKRWLIPIRFFSPRISRLWVSVVTRAPKNRVYPLVMSLKHTLLPRVTHHCPALTKEKTFFAMVEPILLNSENVLPHAYSSSFAKAKTVRSVQRVDLTCHASSEAMAKEYMNWLPKFLYPFILVKVKGERVAFYLRLLPWPLLLLFHCADRSDKGRQLFYIRGGLLARKGGRGRLEFRVLEQPHTLIAAIHDFRPTLPWWLYKYTQALAHLYVMKKFGEHLNAKTVGWDEKMRT